MTAWIWAVELQGNLGISTLKEVKYVRATTREGAERTALAHAFMHNSRVVAARIATPEELGCTAVSV